MNKRDIKSCPNCGKSGKTTIVNRIVYSGSIFDNHLFFIECPSCHWCGKTKLFLWRAKRAWNKEKGGRKNER